MAFNFLHFKNLSYSEVKTHRLRGFPRSETIYLEDPPPLPFPVSVKDDEKEGEKEREEKGEQETTGEEEGHLDTHVRRNIVFSIIVIVSLADSQSARQFITAREYQCQTWREHGLFCTGSRQRRRTEQNSFTECFSL